MPLLSHLFRKDIFKDVAAWAGPFFTLAPTSGKTEFEIPEHLLAPTPAAPGSCGPLTLDTRDPQSLPQPVPEHPRLWLTPALLARLRGRAVTANPLFPALTSLLHRSKEVYDTRFFPGGSPNPLYPDFGDTEGHSGELTEQHALVFAFFSLMDADAAKRPGHARHAHRLLMHAITEAARGPKPEAPFRDPSFMLLNRGNHTGEAWPLIVDWLQAAVDEEGRPILSTDDKRAVRDVFLLWAEGCLKTLPASRDEFDGDTSGATAEKLLPGGNAVRTAADRYYSARGRLLTLMALCLDAEDDPPVLPLCPDATPGNSLRSYLTHATGCWLYQQYALFGEPVQVIEDYRLPPTSNVGLASGGLPPEGSLSCQAFTHLLGQLLALQTSGVAASPALGPQRTLLSAPVWRRFVEGFCHTLVPCQQVIPTLAYLGDIQQVFNYGATLRTWVTADWIQPFALLQLLSEAQGDLSGQAGPLSWLATHTLEGGASRTRQRIQQAHAGGVQNALLAFMLFDPSAPPPVDPRPGLPPVFHDRPQGRLLARSDWSADAFAFAFRSSWESLPQQNADAGQFELFRKGEWITRELSNQDPTGHGRSSVWHNTLALKNRCEAVSPRNLAWDQGVFWQDGSQWPSGESAGDPATETSDGEGYAYAQTDMTPLYNRPASNSPDDACLDILHASRCILWLKDGPTFVYDRAASAHEDLFKRFNLCLTAPPSIDRDARIATVVTPKGQHVWITNLLPRRATMVFLPEAGHIEQVALLEPTLGRLEVEDPTRPSETRFLHTLQVADQPGEHTPARLLTSDKGDAFEGAVAGDTLVLFPCNHGTAVTGLSYRAPSAARRHFVTGLNPNIGYSIDCHRYGESLNILISAEGPHVPDRAGVLYFMPEMPASPRPESVTDTRGHLQETPGYAT